MYRPDPEPFLTPPRLAVLSALTQAGGPVTIGHLGRVLGTTAEATRLRCVWLEEHGLVLTGPSTAVRLTVRGRAKLQHVLAVRESLVEAREAARQREARFERPRLAALGKSLY